MGSSWCGQTTIELPEYSAEFGSSDLPAWVSAGGRALFDQAVGLAGSTPGPSNIDKLASYGPEGNLLTEDEQLAAQILREGAGSYQPFLDKASGVADTLGKGYDSASRSDLLGDAYSGMSESELMGSYRGASRGDLLGSYRGASREDLLGSYEGASREDLLGGGFSLDTAQPYLDIYQGAQDASIRELERQTQQNQIQARANAARSGSFGGSRLGISEAMLGSEGAMGAADLRARAAAEGLGFAENRFDTDRGARFDAENVMRGQYESDRGARFDAENVMRGQFDTDRGARFDAEDVMRGQFDTDRAARFDREASNRAEYDADRSSRFAAEDALRAGFETDEASRIKKMTAFQDLAPLTQSLQEAAAQGLITSGEARRRLDQAALDLARAEDLDQRNQPFERLNFALGALQGVPYEQKNYGYRLGSSTTAGPNLFGQLLGAGGTAAAGYYSGRGK